ncbi:966_t:CDS:2 [Funneliformis geosporum]|uniref:17109_t:CDS:1 n=1 Tax=Funneliformis geosporum TaxID=1117311 RepID=A0A9W4SE12_9GLOM|nr:966_t:CDS:2 [Funneliformis geosporum]CAI2163729.1 17109_t:CDS:2 [Funneliformis geosporum]
MFNLPSETRSVRDYIDTMEDIRNLGIFKNFDNFEKKHTPTIVVFGDQSCGKSSLMQRFTGGLPVPIGTSLCTRAPFEIHMIQSEEPIRKITLRYVEDRNHMEITPREVEFADLTNSYRSDIERKLRDAQRYAQNPSIKDIKTRLPEPNHDELPFTKNAVCLIIGGPAQYYNISLVDLPGFVRNVENNEKFIISLVKEYINRDSAILIPIIQATADISTQCALLLALEADPNGLRTVGALTKIDRIIEYPNDEDKHLELAKLVKSKGEHQIVKGVHQIVNGVYVIRNRSNVEPEDSDDTLESDTIRELKKQKSWKDVPTNMFGLQNLVMKLIELQEECHKRTWPKIRPILEDCRDEFEKRLNSLPHKSIENPIIRFSELIGKFDKLFTSHANAEHVDHKLYRGQQWNFGQFDQALLKTRPIYLLSFDGGSTMAEIFDPIKPGALQYRGWSNTLMEEIRATNWEEIDFNNSDGNSKYMWSMDKLYEVVQDKQGGLLVGYFPYKAVVSIVGKHQEEWLSISTKLLNKNHDWVASYTDVLIDDTFKEFPDVIGEIKNVLHDLLRKCKDETLKHLKDLEEMEHMSASRALYVTDEASLLKKQSEYFIKLRILAAGSKRTNQDLKAVLELGSKLFDMMYDKDVSDNDFDKVKTDLIDLIDNISEREDFNDESAKKLIGEIEKLDLATNASPSSTTLSTMLSIKNSYLDRLIRVIPESDDSRNHSILKNTIKEHAFLAATGALAYWKMSHSKFREIVPRIVEYYLVHQFAIRLGMHLRTHFRLLGVESTNPVYPTNKIDLESLLGEDPSVAKNRAEWQKNINALNGIIDRVRKVSAGSYYRNQNNHHRDNRSRDRGRGRGQRTPLF